MEKEYEFNDAVKIQAIEAAELQIVTKALHQRAEHVIDQYHAEVETLIPQAESSLFNIIVPWWSEWISSGDYKRVFEHLSQNQYLKGEPLNPVASLSTPIVFPWPKIILNNENDQKLAEAALKRRREENVRDTDLIDICPPHYDLTNLWTANFYLAGERQSRHNPGLGIARWPIIGGGFAYAMGARKQNDIPLNIDEPEDIIQRVHPEILIEFAQQVQTGKVWDKLGKSLKPGPTVFTTREKVLQEDTRRAQKYWVKRIDRQKSGE